ncbi:hypothetical protein FAF44_33680 [Nonomuraea sp. MG754425]|uniref:hypothetical protein n=1 Tax=Nonomuraea sp. MG754425 TaxID=2570319 RepID=UPI001F29A16D|nr:hypothetical protein [Nonomuraea sp. MG754425]MCF6473298.1 hypothetical protein [Nonomuraea sp. MG754425]
MPDAPLLHYSTSTAPLQAGTPDKPAANTIDITVSSPAAQQIYCDELDVAVPVSAPDDGGAYFTENPQSSITGKWGTASAQVKSGRELGLDPATNYYHVVFQAPPIPGFDLIDTPLIISITGNVAATPGSELACPTTETSGTTSGKYARKTPQDLTWDTAKPAFYLHSFLAVAPDEPTVPRTKFNAGAEISLTWESNGSYFQLYDGDGTTLHEGPATSWTVPPGRILNDTTFTLQASETQESTPGFRPVYQYATLAITINNPTLSELTVTGKIAAKSRIDVDGILWANDTVWAGNGMNIYCHGGNTDVATFGERVSFNKTLHIDSDLEVDGELTVNDGWNAKLTTKGTDGLKVRDFQVTDDL